MNIVDAYVDDRFDPSVDESKTFKHRSILCMAIKNSLSQIIGVIQLVNKFDSLVKSNKLTTKQSITNSCNTFSLKQKFTRNDENFVEAFAIFCGMGIHNTHMYEKAIVAMAKQSVTLEVLSYHASATVDDAERLRVIAIIRYFNIKHKHTIFCISQRLKIPSAAFFQLHDFKFDDILMDDDDTLRVCCSDMYVYKRI